MSAPGFTTTLAAGRISLSTLTSVQMMGSTAGTYIDLPSRAQDSAGLRITLPSSSAPFAAPAYVVKLAFSGQVIWFQGDGHRFIDDKPMKTTGGSVIQSFRRIQVEGDSRVSYVRLHVDPGGSTLFTTTLSKRY